jgi:SAM-dependent methyltransferase
MLHVAPEPSLMERFRAVALLEYITGDLDSPLADVKLDLRDLQFSDGHFDVIYCSHVLEHIEEDRRAIRELRRVCRATGWANLQVPITAERTFEDPEITDPDERHRVFGQFDHVRRCGPDYAERLDEGGFTTHTIYARDILNPSDCERHGIDTKRLIFFCRPTAVAERPEPAVEES